jgi:hypothetical protein
MASQIHVAIRTKMSENPRRLNASACDCAVDKRDIFVAELRDEARRKGLSFRAEKRRGKVGHMLVYVGDRLTTLPSREIDPKTARKIRKQLGLAD